MNTQILKYFNKPIYRHILYWLIVFSFYLALDGHRYRSTEKLLETKFVTLLFQIVTAYSLIYFIIPRFYERKRVFEFIFLFLLLLIVLNIVDIIWQDLGYNANQKTCYGINTCYSRFKSKYGHLPFWHQIYEYKTDFFFLSWTFVQPTFFLTAFLSYQKQQKLSEINEQKKIVELKALKNQLNPHFLFNTLNNLYTLTLEKSDTAPEVIEKLSSMLDYMLYRCDETYVPIEKEIELIENYLSLEQIRYEDRVTISFKDTVSENVKIAPLLLLTFIENAFKHGVSQELDMATVVISLTTEENNIVFTITNTKPQIEALTSTSKKRIGLKNIENQLQLLYPNNYKLNIENTETKYMVHLKLKKH